MVDELEREYTIKFADGVDRRVRVGAVRREGRITAAKVQLDGDEAPAEATLFLAADGVCSLELIAAGGRMIRSGMIVIESQAGAEHMRVVVDGTRYGLACREARLVAALERFAETASADGGGAAVIASPIPGRVVIIQVQPGDHVEPGQCVAVIEAMKMENEVLSESAGIVAEILVAPGQTVESGASLLRLQ